MKDDLRGVIDRQLVASGVADVRLAALARREFSGVVGRQDPIVVAQEARRVVRQVIALGECEQRLRRRFVR